MMADTGLQARRYSDADAFYRVAGPVLEVREAQNCLPLGIAATLVAHPERYPDPPYLATITDGEQIVGIAVRTPPHNLVLAAVGEDTLLDAPRQRAILDVLIADVHVVYGASLPGVVGPADRAHDFAETWSATMSVTPTLAMSERVYRLDTVHAPTGVPGQMRRVAEGDRDLMERWIAAFEDEALHGEAHADASRWTDWALAAPAAVHGVYLWEVGGQPVSLAGYGNPTPHGMRIGPVYTPPELRGHGYASGLTAGISQVVLDMGKQFCTLFTDLANSTSNKIYQQVGYMPVGDAAMYAFG